MLALGRSGTGAEVLDARHVDLLAAHAARDPDLVAHVLLELARVAHLVELLVVLAEEQERARVFDHPAAHPVASHRAALHPLAGPALHAATAGSGLHPFALRALVVGPRATRAHQGQDRARDQSR